MLGWKSHFLGGGWHVWSLLSIWLRSMFLSFGWQNFFMGVMAFAWLGLRVLPGQTRTPTWKKNDGLAANSPKMPVIHLDSGWLRDIHHPDGSEHVCIRGHNRTMFGFLSRACVNYHYLGCRVNEIPKRISATQLLSGKPWKRYIRCWWPNSTECTIWWKKPNPEMMAWCDFYLILLSRIWANKNALKYLDLK